MYDALTILVPVGVAGLWTAGVALYYWIKG